ncbi:MAG: hypothetical protein Barrevirus37_4 [Barrevirus sp.]|uniref:Uncharacterized protein n=1 Tax=Barrevirus sp. TaxID=2487763 RepID=A0A3G4ZR32_9VIRU|nr:MAG: hypothetical protein Barrevirus37_4 [Barrevirus sp.]
MIFVYFTDSYQNTHSSFSISIIIYSFIIMNNNFLFSLWYIQVLMVNKAVNQGWTVTKIGRNKYELTIKKNNWLHNNRDYDLAKIMAHLV